jgi:DNA polymerase-3 subunit alpha (Gram-positive type)
MTRSQITTPRFENPQITQSNQYKLVSMVTKKWSTQCRKEFVAIDLETTGFSAVNDYIIEICAIRYKNGIYTEKYTTLIKPPITIPDHITKINNINNEMTCNAPAIDAVIPEIINFIGSSIIVAHNASFDMSFLDYNASKLGLVLNNNVVDTVSASRKLLPNLKNHKLGTLVKHFKISVNTCHRAEADAMACGTIVLKLLEIYTFTSNANRQMVEAE